MADVQFDLSALTGQSRTNYALAGGALVFALAVAVLPLVVLYAVVRSASRP